jgi:predicted Rossmann fold flavoprotein
MMADFDLIVIGGGAAGFYGAIQAAEMDPGFRVIILEKSGKLLSKVRISGGGRCNVTHHCFDPVKLSHHYPRGEKPLRFIFKKYDAAKTVAWFASKGIRLKTEDDGRMFPQTDDSETIIDCFIQQARRLNIQIETGQGVEDIKRFGVVLEIITSTGRAYYAPSVLIATGGSPKVEPYDFIKKLGHTIKPPVPSLFTFNDSGKRFTDLMGVSVTNAEVRIATAKFKNQGPLLITHWGLSGPVIIRLSAWAAEYLHSVHYDFTVLVSWIGPAQEDAIREFLQSQKISRVKQKIYNNPLFELPLRLWVRLCELAEIPDEKIWGEIGLRHLNKLLEYLIKCPFQIKGKTTFKEEFVTCGGVDLSEVDLQTMESKKVKGVFFAGEVLNIDGETGGFNFQAAWSTAFLAAKSSISYKM